MDPLSVRLVTDAVVYPTIRVASHPGRLLMGVYDGGGTYVDGTVLDRRSGEQGEPVPPGLFPLVGDADEPEAIYAGPLYHHFGHFLLESLARTWSAAQHPAAPLVWAGQHDWPEPGLRPWQAEVLDLLGLVNPTRVVTGPTRFGRLHVPDLGYRYDDRFHPEHAAFLGRYEGPAQEPGRRLWLSRSGIATDVRDVNAGPTERRLREAGWAVAHPERLGVREQLDELARASVVAGEEGSAFHALILLSDVSSKRFHVFRRRGPEHRNLRTIGAVRHVDQTFHTLADQVVLSAEGRAVSKISPNASAVLDALDVPVPPRRPGPAPDPALAKVVADLGPLRLLEVGVRRPEVVLGADAPVRVVVSPHLDDDPRSLAGSGVEVYELALEPYAAVFHGRRPRFDVIRLAGTELTEVLAAFDTSQALAEPHATWVLGSGDLAARVALAVRTRSPGHSVKRWFVRGRSVYVVRREPGALDDADVEALSAAEVRRRVRWLRPVSPARVRRRRRRARS